MLLGGLARPRRGCLERGKLAQAGRFRRSEAVVQLAQEAVVEVP